MLSFIKSRPPLVVFFICMLTTVLALTYFIIAIKMKSLIPDTDVIYDWNQLIKHFNKLEGCVNGRNNSKNGVHSADETTVQTLIHINTSDFKHFRQVDGYLISDGWHSGCPDKYPALPKYFKLSFLVPNNVTLDTAAICANVTASKSYLPKFSEPNCIAPQNTINQAVGFYSADIKKPNGQFCRDGAPAKVTFSPQNKNNFADYLTADQKNTVYIHLLWTSCAIILVLLILLIYAALHNNHNLDRYLDKCPSFIDS